MEIIRTKKALTEAIRGLRANGKTIGFAPTMGALHAGHISLVDIAKSYADEVVASIFVNPTQFGPNEDFAKYPRTEADDTAKLEKAGVAIVYLPSVEEMYPKGAKAMLSAGPIGRELCGAFRPGHFDGVVSVVAELFRQVTPDVAVFGEKDYQQLHVIREMVRDQQLPVRIIGAPIMRERDGLAMSSRNRYLSEKERKLAGNLYKILQAAAQKLQEGQGRGALEHAKRMLQSSEFTKVDYVELRDAETLAPVENVKKPARLLAAVYLDTTRLIDNVEVLP